MRHEEKRRCGANAKSTGLPCQRFPMENGRCYFHGGVVKPWKNRNQFTKGNVASVTHGIYSDNILFDDEREIYENLKLGNLDEELRMLRILLRRRYHDLKIEEEIQQCEDLKEYIRSLEARLQKRERKRDKLLKALMGEGFADHFPCSGFNYNRG
jgi:hypothetical protein